MVSFSNEFSDGTFDLLLSNLLKPFEIILGKFFSQIIILVLAITPTIFYTYYLTCDDYSIKKYQKIIKSYYLTN